MTASRGSGGSARRVESRERSEFLGRRPRSPHLDEEPRCLACEIGEPHSPQICELNESRRSPAR